MRLKDALRLPGMKILHFHMAERGDGRYSFDTEPNCLVYTGTHDNNTTLGWYEDDLDESGRCSCARLWACRTTPRRKLSSALSSPMSTAAVPKRSSYPCRTYWPCRETAA